MDQQLVFLESPLCPLAAEAVQSEDTIYFYLYDMNFEEEQLQTRCACWVKNLVDAPDDFDFERMKEGTAPLMPKAYIREDMTTDPLDPEDLEIVWSKEGHIAALCEGDQVLCILPSWATPDMMPGYSRYCSEDCLVAWPLTNENQMLTRIEEGKQFWAQDLKEAWISYIHPYIKDLNHIFGEEIACYELNKDTFPTYYLFVFEKQNVRYAFTVGMGMFAMPNTDQYFDDYENKAYCELAFSWEKDSLSEEEEQQVISQLGGLANLPWQSANYIGHGHTIDFDVQGYPYAIIIRNEELLYHTNFAITKQNVCVNWVIPISAHEFDTMQKEKSSLQMIEIIKQENRCIYARRKEA